MMLDRNFAPGFRIMLHIKDLNNALETGSAVGAPVPLTTAMLDMMTALKADGHELEDYSALVQYYEKIAEIELSRAEVNA